MDMQTVWYTAIYWYIFLDWPFTPTPSLPQPFSLSLCIPSIFIFLSLFPLHHSIYTLFSCPTLSSLSSLTSFSSPFILLSPVITVPIFSLPQVRECLLWYRASPSLHSVRTTALLGREGLFKTDSWQVCEHFIVTIYLFMSHILHARFFLLQACLI